MNVILSFIKALLPNIEKNQVLEDLRITQSELESMVLPSFNSASDYFKTAKFISNEAKDAQASFYRSFDLQGGSKQPTLVNEINRRLPAIRENAAYITELIEKTFEPDTITEGITAKKAVLLRAAEHISFVSQFSMDLLNQIYVWEASEANADVAESMHRSPGDQKRITSRLQAYAQLLSNYGIPRKDFEKCYVQVPDVHLSEKTQSVVANNYKAASLDPFGSGLIQGFIGSPIYHIRLVYANWQTARYKSKQTLKKTLELRLLHLKTLSANKNDPSLEKEIKYQQNRIDNLEQEIREAEQSVGM